MSIGSQSVVSRTYWRTVLDVGGATTLPRWTLHPTPGVADHEAPIPADDVAALRGLEVPLRSVVLAAHAVVLAALAGEPDVVIGYATGPDRRPLPCRLTTAPGSWRELVRETHRAESELRAHADFPVDDLRRELGLPGPSFDTVFGASGDPDEAPLQVGVVDRDGRPVLRLRYRTDVLDASAAARVAGYHLTALALIAADPDARHRGQSLLSADELRFQLDGLAGPHRDLPDRRVHELFEQRVAAHPDTVAAEHRGRTWSYRELNARANRLGRALLARGLPPESVVAVVTERNLDWVAAVLGIWKAGLAYLPLEPHFPTARIATALARAQSRLVLTEDGSSTTLDPALDALPGVERLVVDTAYGEGHSDENLGVAVPADGLAYVLFTSGSTGEPKGVMCEHAGMLNHIVAKLDDLGGRRGRGDPADRPAVLRHLGLAAGRRARGRRHDPAGGAAGDPGRRAVRRHDRRRAGRGAAGGAVVPRRDPRLPGAAPPRAAGPAHGVPHRRPPQEGAGAALVRGSARHPDGQHLWADRDLGRRRARGHAGSSGRGAGPARPPDHQHLGRRRRREPRAGAARRARTDRLLRDLRRPRLHQRPGAHGAGVRARPAAPGAAGLPHRRPRPLAARRHPGLPRPPRQPDQDPRLPDRDRRDRERAAARARCPRRSRGRRRPPAAASTSSASTPARSRWTTTVRRRLAEALPDYMVPTACHWRETCR